MKKHKESSTCGAFPIAGAGRPYIFAHPEPERAGREIFPVFLPFAGCPQRCIYCAQDFQAGRDTAPVPRILADAARDLAAKAGPLEELAFYGGTFTALPAADLEHCLAFARDLIAAGRIQRFRCSTRPDAVNPTILKRLRQAGCALVELGVQSFSDAALAASGRGYDGTTAEQACRMVTASGLALGIQLMPGMPGLPSTSALEDAARAAALAPACARLYPCVVFAGSPLAHLWNSGAFIPLSTPDAVDILGRSCLLLWKSGVRVIRMGLAETDRLRANVLAGPLHPALGNLARIRALFLLIEEHVQMFRRIIGDAPLLLRIPRSRQGEAFAPAGTNLAPYASLGIERLETHEAPDFLLLPA